MTTIQLPSGLATDLANSIQQVLATNDPAESQWMTISELLADQHSPPETYRQIWDSLFDGDGRRPMWWPNASQIADSNVAKWYQALGLTDYPQFHRWSIENRADFWSQAAQQLGIQFDQTGSEIASDLDSPSQTIWFPNHRLNIIESCLQADPTATAIVSQSPGGELVHTSYGQLRLETNQIANSLVAAGFKPGDRIGVALPMTRWSVPIYLGIVAAGCAVVSIADSFAAPEIRTRLELAQAKAVFTYDLVDRLGKQLPLYDRVKAATELPIIVLPLGDQLQDDIREQDLAWHSFLVADQDFTPIIGSSNDCINVLFSSGTTGDPKAIVWNHLTPLRCAVDGFVHHNIQPGDVVAWPTNLGWMMGPWLIFASLINKASVALFEDAPMASEFGRFVEQAKVTMLGVVPTIVKHWRKTRVMEEFDWRNIKCFSSTGETSQPDEMFYLSSIAGMRPVIEYCGGTEIGGGYVTSTMQQPNAPSTFTTPAAGLDFYLLDNDNNPATEGEVYLVPPSVGLSNSLLNRDHFETYYADTPSGPDGQQLRRHGDHFRKVGEYFVAGGRVDDTMNLGGIKISSAELERVMNRIDPIRETAAIAVADELGPDRLVVFTVLDRDVAADELVKEMNLRLKQELNPLFRVSQVELVDSLPRTASNKVMRRKLRDRIVGNS